MRAIARTYFHRYKAITDKTVLLSKELKPCHWFATRTCHSKRVSALENVHVKPPRSYGQPTPTTHPHLLAPGEVTAGLSQKEFIQRRFRLMEAIGKCNVQSPDKGDHHIVIIPSAVKRFMSEKIPYIFYQNADFLYMTGFQEPNSVLVLESKPGTYLPTHKSTLFVQNRDSHAEIWEGPVSGVEGALDLLGVDDALDINQLENFLKKRATYLAEKVVVWYDFYNPPNPDVHKIVKYFIHNCTNVCCESPRPLFHRLRLIKSAAEMALMQKSCDIASDAFVEVMRSSKANCSESDLHARMEYECRIRGADFLAYPPVVAGGKRATTIHYIDNNQRIKKDELVLMDAGCYFHGYISDITRTWPVERKFTSLQRALYEAILDMQQQLIKLCQNRPSLDELFLKSNQLLAGKLKELGLISSQLSEAESVQIAQQFCPHHVSHYLGMDVHDSAVIPRSIQLQPGMIFTIEPGIYINENNRKVPPEFRGIGIRIEDNILITESGPVVLSAKCPKTVTELEKM